MGTIYHDTAKTEIQGLLNHIDLIRCCMIQMQSDGLLGRFDDRQQ